MKTRKDALIAQLRAEIDRLQRDEAVKVSPVPKREKQEPFLGHVAMAAVAQLLEEQAANYPIKIGADIAAYDGLRLRAKELRSHIYGCDEVKLEELAADLVLTLFD